MVDKVVYNNEILRHDLLLLGIGDDGHTASLFPETKALNESSKWVSANYVPKLDTHRITLTYPLINASEHVLFLVNDHKKDAVINSILKGDKKYPASLVSAKRITWMIGDIT
jgi:6-phosphogluconolactonase